MNLLLDLSTVGGKGCLKHYYLLTKHSSPSRPGSHALSNRDGTLPLKTPFCMCLICFSFHSLRNWSRASSIPSSFGLEIYFHVYTVLTFLVTFLTTSVKVWSTSVTGYFHAQYPEKGLDFPSHTMRIFFLWIYCGLPLFYLWIYIIA